MREIEVKVRIADARQILDALKRQDIAVSEPVTQHDRVYGLPGVVGSAENGEPWLRIRTETKQGATVHYFTLKKSVTGQLDSIEHETRIDDDAELDQIIAHMGFVPYSEVTKTRQKAKVGDIEVCIDHVEGLGDFVEAEKLTADDADYGTVVAELWQVLESFGADRVDEVTDGYDVLMNKMQGKE